MTTHEYEMREAHEKCDYCPAGYGNVNEAHCGNKLMRLSVMLKKTLDEIQKYFEEIKAERRRNEYLQEAHYAFVCQEAAEAMQILIALGEEECVQQNLSEKHAMNVAC